MSEVIHGHHALYLNPARTIQAAFSRPVYYIDGVERGHPRERCAWHCDDRAGALHVWRNRWLDAWDETIPYDAITSVAVAPSQQSAFGVLLLGKQEVVTIHYHDAGRERALVLAGKLGQLEKLRQRVSERAGRTMVA